MIRNMQIDDAIFVREICEAALGHKAEAEALRRRIGALTAHPAYYISVYEDGKKVLGFLQAEQYDVLYGESGWNIIALAVAPKAQGRGIGTQLVKALEDHARQREGAFVRLNCRVERAGAHRFYERLGYSCDKIQKRFMKYLHAE